MVSAMSASVCGHQRLSGAVTCGRPARPAPGARSKKKRRRAAGGRVDERLVLDVEHVEEAAVVGVPAALERALERVERDRLERLVGDLLAGLEQEPGDLD